MYQDWMENTPIFGKIKDIYIDNKTENSNNINSKTNS